MDKASDFESEDCGFESHLGHVFFYLKEITETTNFGEHNWPHATATSPD